MVSTCSHISHKQQTNEVNVSCVQNHPFLDGKLPDQWSWNIVTDYWPRRLLHIPSMNSVKRDEHNVYYGVPGVEKAEKPKYSILTYTWGRWKIRNANGCPALPVLNTSWDIPAIKEEHFTFEEFQRVVNFLGKDGVDWAWIDVACIDQEDQEANAEEVGRQASIFKNSHRVFVWLSHLHSDVLASAVVSIQESGLALRDHVDELPTSLPIEDVIGSLHRGFNVVFADPWFSSLWTLQEVILRNDAIALSKEAETIVWDHDHCTYMTMFINHCQNVFQDLESAEKRIEKFIGQASTRGSVRQEMKKQIYEMKQLILQAGFYFLFSNNPNVQYGVARYRRTSRDVDRVYAIMQIYNLRVGKSIRPKEQPPLAELIDEFAAAISQRCPIMGQMFLHTQVPEQFKSWRITEFSTVPQCLIVYQEPQPRSKLTMMSGTMVAKGPCCLFAELFSMSPKPPREITFGIAFELALDTHVVDGLAYQQSTAKPGPSNDLTLGLQVIMLYGRTNVWVLWLGDIRAEWNVPRRRFLRKQVGLLLTRTGQTYNEDRKHLSYQRLGVCTWVAFDDKDEEVMNRLPWDEVELLLY